LRQAGGEGGVRRTRSTPVAAAQAVERRRSCGGAGRPTAQAEQRCRPHDSDGPAGTLAAPLRTHPLPERRRRPNGPITTHAKLSQGKIPSRLAGTGASWRPGPRSRPHGALQGSEQWGLCSCSPGCGEPLPPAPGGCVFLLPPPCVCLRSGRILHVSRSEATAPTRWAQTGNSRERREWAVGICGRATDPHPMAPVCLSPPLYA
jgi:hypothetical protein